MSSGPSPTSGSAAQPPLEIAHNSGSAQVTGSSYAVTNPHPDSELAARLAGDPSEDDDIHQLLGRPRVEVPRENSTPPVAIRDFPTNQLPSDARLVMSPSGALTNSMSKEELVPIHHPETPGDVYVVSQTSAAAWFSFSSDTLSFQLFYDTASDNLVFLSQSRLRLALDGIRSDNTSDISKHRLLFPRSPVEVSPGPWRISTSDSNRTPLCDFLLLRRRYTAELSASSSLAGTKRKSSALASGQKKRAAEDDSSLVVINTVPVKGSARARLTVVKDGNAMHDVQPGTALQVKPHNGSEPRELIRSSDQPEQYSISNMRDIVTTAAASLFYGSHSTHGLIAVKSLRQRHFSTHPVVPTFAEYWEREKRLLQLMKHPSIVKFVGADARFFSIYMEYLPYPDLTGFMTLPDNMFSGTLEDTMQITRDMLSALEYLRGQNVLHNDIKPANILYDQSRGAILIDFGLASSAGSVCTGGTAWYVPPEFLQKGQRHFQSDIFALGVTLLFLLGKSSMPDLQGDMWIIARVRTDAKEGTRMRVWLVKVAEMRDRLGSTGLEAAVKAMLDPDPGNRESARELRKRLERNKAVCR